MLSVTFDSSPRSHNVEYHAYLISFQKFPKCRQFKSLTVSFELEVVSFFLRLRLLCGSDFSGFSGLVFFVQFVDEFDQFRFQSSSFDQKKVLDTRPMAMIHKALDLGDISANLNGRKISVQLHKIQSLIKFQQSRQILTVTKSGLFRNYMQAKYTSTVKI